MNNLTGVLFNFSDIYGLFTETIPLWLGYMLSMKSL